MLSALNSRLTSSPAIKKKLDKSFAFPVWRSFNCCFYHYSLPGLEKEFDQRLMPDGRLNIDGFVCVFDVSLVPNRTLEKQVETTAQILNSLLKTKKPIVLATTKNDEGNEIFIREAERLLNRKDYKGIIPLVETSSHDNINVDQAFFLGNTSVTKDKPRQKGSLVSGLISDLSQLK